jgi:TonB-linked SusC/RagA family outer membrane protein
MMIKNLLYLINWRKPALFIAMLCFCCAAFAQGSFKVSGTVYDGQSQPLPGVTVKVKGESAGTLTDVNGRYTVSASNGNATLVFTYIGFKAQEVAINGRALVNVNLTDDAAKLNEVVVVGYGTQSRATISTSVSKLDNKVLETIPYPNLTTAMQGTLPGVRVQTTTGQPGASARVIIRGGASIANPNTATPLYIVDGIQRNDINDISSEDVESLQVLKDAASTSIYGSRASNGVIIVTTKTGKSGRTSVNYSYDLTVGEVSRKYDIINARDYLYYGRLAIQESLNRGYILPATATARLNTATSIGTGNNLTNNTAFTPQYLNNDPTNGNAYKLNQGWESMPDPLDPTKTIIFQGTNWNDALYRTSYSNNHHVNVSGGNDKATFNAGVGYMSSDGTVITTKYDRLSFNLNGSYKIRDNINVFGRVYYTNATSNASFLADQLVFLRYAGLPPTTKYTFEDGTLAPGASQGVGNPAYQLSRQNNNAGNETTNYSIGGKWEIIKGLSFDPQFSLYRVNNFARTFAPSYQNGPGAANLVTSRIATNNTLRTDQYQADAILTYLTAFGDHHLEVKGGLSYYTRTNNTFTITGQGAATDLIPTVTASSIYSGVTNNITNLRLPGYIGRINYDYQQKYLLTVNARYDGSSTFGASNRFGLFPGVSAGWVLNKEKFWDALPKDLLTVKLRGSYGVNGNIGQGLLTEYYAQGDYGLSGVVTQQKYDGVTGILANNIANADLKWERSKTVDLGADLGLFNNRVSIIFDYYRKVTNDLLASLTPPQSTGISSLITNLGSLENKGLELEIGAKILPSSSKLAWNASFNAARNTHKILTLPPSGVEGNRVGGLSVFDPASGTYKFVAANNGLIEGGQIGDWYGFKALGVYATDAAAASAPIDNVIGAVKTKRGGDVIWQDTDNNGVIDTRDKVYLGNPFPKWTGGFSNTLAYKNLSLYLRLDFSAGFTIFNYARAFLDGNYQGDNAPTKEYFEKSWKQQGDITDIPKYNPSDASSAQNILRGNAVTGVSSQYVEKGDYIAIRELTLSYSIPSTILKKLKMSNLRFSVSGNNLHYFTGYKGPNPEDGGFTLSPSLKGDYGRYPVARNIIFGANVTF